MSEEGRQNRDQLEAAGYELHGNHFLRGGERFLPLYEAKMMHQYTHRWASYQRNDKTREMSSDELRDPHNLPMPRYWVHESEVAAKLEKWSRAWFLGFRSIARTTDERTTIATIIPYTAVSGKLPLIFPEAEHPATLLANLNSYALDYVARQKIGGTDMAFFYLKQLPVIPPHTYFDDKIRKSTIGQEQNREHSFSSTSSAHAYWN